MCLFIVLVSLVLYKELYARGSQPVIMYGLSKTHKPLINNFPKLCPILSAINTATYSWAKFFVPLLVSLLMSICLRIHLNLLRT